MRALTFLLAGLPLLAVLPKPSTPVNHSMTKKTDNPLLQPWNTPFGVPPFQKIRVEDFATALPLALQQHKAEIHAIATSKLAPDFGNTVAALDDSGVALARVSYVFGLLTGAETTEALQALEAKFSPVLTAHQDDINLDEALFKRVKAVYEQRNQLSLSTEERRLLEAAYRRFVRGGADLAPTQKTKLRALNAELSTLGVKFSENLLKETTGYRLVVTRREDLAGLPESQVQAAADEARKAGIAQGWVFTLKSPSLWPFLQSAQNRELRREILQAYASRCDKGGATDNKAIFARIAQLRVEKAQLLGYRTWANFILDEYMARTPEGANKLLAQLWQPALDVAKAERADLQAMMDKDLPGQKLEAWDWRYYAAKVQKAKFDLDEEALRPYFPLEKVREGAFTVAQKLYGFTFTERKDLPSYHPEAKAFEVKEADGRHVGILYMDFHPRAGKRGGAWCSNLRDQWVDNGRFVSPIVYNVCNFSRPTGEAPALLSPEEVDTLFHEFGHALHALSSQVRYRGSGLVAQDFVELPSQVMENWAFEPEVLKLYARHWKTGELIPAELVAKLKKAGTFNQGFVTVEYLAAALLDMDWHSLTEAKSQDATAFEQKSLAKWGLIPEILVRYRTPYFAHSAGEYSAGYYSYIWSAVLDSDAFQAFKEKGDLFHPATAKAFRQLLSKGGSEDPATLYRTFRGADPNVEPLLKKRGLK